MRKGLFFILLAWSLGVVVVVALLLDLALGSGRMYQPVELALSFKPFTIQEMLNLDVEVDQATCGERIQSEELETIQQRVAEIRELPLEEPVVFRECPESVIRYELLESLVEESSEEEFEADEKLLVALGLIPPEENLRETLTDVYTEQIAGYYDPETGDITMVKGKGTGSLMDEITLAHEITHALQNQHFDLEAPPLENDDYNGDNDFAVLSLIEGDAMTTMLKYAQEYVDLTRLYDEELAGTELSSEELDEAPVYIQRSLMFPYEEGFTFVMALDESGGERAVDEALRNPPMSSEQIMHPEKYLEGGDEPREVPLPDISGELGDGWEMINSDTMGEFDVDVWFEEYSGMLASVDVAGGWGGNTIQYYQGPDDRYLVVNMFAWDTPEDAVQFFDGYRELLDDRFEGETKEVDGDSDWYLLEADGELFYCALAGDGTLCVQAPDRQALDTVLKSYPGYPK